MLMNFSEFSYNSEILVFEFFFKSVVELLVVQLNGIFSRVMWNLAPKIYPKFLAFDPLIKKTFQM